MKPVIIIAIVFVLLIPISAYAQEGSRDMMEEYCLANWQKDPTRCADYNEKKILQNTQKYVDGSNSQTGKSITFSVEDLTNTVKGFTDIFNLVEPIVADFTNLTKPALQEIGVLDYIQFDLFMILFVIGLVGIILGVTVKQRKKSSWNYRTQKCVECGGQFYRIDVYKFPKSKLKSDWVCRSDVQTYLQKIRPVKESGRDLWMCSTCRPMQKFISREAYINHHMTAHN